MSRVLASPDFSFLPILIAMYFGALLVMIAIIVGTGVKVYRVTRGPARKATLVSVAAAFVAVSVWAGVFGVDVPLPWMLIGFAFTMSVVSCLAYPVVWAYLVVREPGPRRRIAVGILVVAAVVGLNTASLPFYFWIAKHDGSPQAFRVLRTEAAIYRPVLAVASRVMFTPDINQWIANNHGAPPDVLAALARSGDYIVQTAALRNPSVPLSALTDTSLWRLTNGRYSLVTNPMLPPAALAVLIRQYPDTRYALAFDPHYLRDRADTSILRILSTDTSAFLRAAVARSPFTPSDVLAVLATDTTSAVRQALRR